MHQCSQQSLCLLPQPAGTSLGTGSSLVPQPRQGTPMLLPPGPTSASKTQPGNPTPGNPADHLHPLPVARGAEESPPGKGRTAMAHQGQGNGNEPMPSLSPWFPFPRSQLPRVCNVTYSRAVVGRMQQKKARTLSCSSHLGFHRSCCC